MADHDALVFGDGVWERIEIDDVRKDNTPIPPLLRFTLGLYQVWVIVKVCYSMCDIL